MEQDGTTRRHKVKSTLRVCQQRLKEKDNFGEGFSMNLDRGKSELHSCAGLISSILLGIIVIMYAYLKTDVLINNKDVNLLQSINQYFYSDEDIFSYKNGLNIAVALTSYDENIEWILDRKYGELVFQVDAWGVDPETGVYENHYSIIESDVCTSEQLGLVDDGKGAEFMPLHPQAKLTVLKNQKKFLCAKKEEIYISGNFDSE